MEIVLSKNVKSLTGSLGRGFGYHIKHRKNGFFGERNSKGSIPPDGHWRFIVACAELAQMSLHIADVKVSRNEITDALWEAGKQEEAKLFFAHLSMFHDVYDALEVLEVKKVFGL